MGRAPDALGGASRLVAVKAVSDGYPLRGRLKLKDGPRGRTLDAAGAPERGTVWVDPSLLDALQLKMGDALLLGDASLTIARLIVVEPDRGAGFMSFAPRVMLNHADLAATGLVQPASRVNYRLAVASPIGRDADIADFVRWAETQIDAARPARCARRVDGIGAPRDAPDARPRRQVPQPRGAAGGAAGGGGGGHRLARFRQPPPRRLRDAARAGRSRSAASRWPTRWSSARSASAPARSACCSACRCTTGSSSLLAGLVSSDLPPPGLWPALFGLGVGLTLLMGFGLPPVLQLARVPPLRVIRRDVGALKASSLAVLGTGTLGFAALLVAVSTDLKMGLIAVGGFAAAAALFALLSWAAVMALKRTVPEARAPRWLVLATRQIAARPAFAVLQVSALAVGLLALVLLVLLRTDLIASWRAATPPDAPNRFVINIQPEQGEAFRQALTAAGITRYDWYPMIRGRLVSINGRPVAPDSFSDERAKRLVEREFNLSHDAQLPGHNRISAGRWTADEADAVSVEDGLAKTLGVKLGDRLAFDIAGTLREGRITSLRKVDWGFDARQLLRDIPDRGDAGPAGHHHRRVPGPGGRDGPAQFRQRARRAISPTSPMSTSRRRSVRCSACSTR